MELELRLVPKLDLVQLDFEQAVEELVESTSELAGVGKQLLPEVAPSE